MPYNFNYMNSLAPTRNTACLVPGAHPAYACQVYWEINNLGILIESQQASRGRWSLLPDKKCMGSGLFWISLLAIQSDLCNLKQA